METDEPAIRIRNGGEPDRRIRAVRDLAISPARALATKVAPPPSPGGNSFTSGSAPVWPPPGPTVSVAFVSGCLAHQRRRSPKPSLANQTGHWAKQGVPHNGSIAGGSIRPNTTRSAACDGHRHLIGMLGAAPQPTAAESMRCYHGRAHRERAWPYSPLCMQARSAHPPSGYFAGFSSVIKNCHGGRHGDLSVQPELPVMTNESSEATPARRIAPAAALML
jgi:hypothetical protein